MPHIIISHASKSIKKRLILDDVSLELPTHDIYGFSGINGSGKSMLFKAISGLIHLDSGYIDIDDKRIGRDISFPQSLGLMISAGFWDEYTGFENLKLIASIRKICSDADIAHALERVGLNPQDKRTYKQYSLGMKQRLELAQAIMERPDLYILDEPSNALDVHGLELLTQIIQEEFDRGATILIAAHNAPEISQLCTIQYEMYEGRVVDVHTNK